MTELTPDAVRQQIRDLYGFCDETWAAIEAVVRAEQRARNRDRARMEAHIKSVAASMPERMRAEGYDVPEGLRFEFEVGHD